MSTKIDHKMVTTQSWVVILLSPTRRFSRRGGVSERIRAGPFYMDRSRMMISGAPGPFRGRVTPAPH